MSSGRLVDGMPSAPTLDVCSDPSVGRDTGSP